MQFSIDLIDPGTAAAVRKLGLAGERALANMVLRGGIEVGRVMKRIAPKAFSTLANSIGTTMIGPLESITASGVGYGGFVERGTGPGGTPPILDILEWLRVKRIEPRDPAMTVADLAYVVARSIRAKGTPPRPFTAPALEQSQARLHELGQQTLARIAASFGV